MKRPKRTKSNLNVTDSETNPDTYDSEEDEKRG